MAEYEPFTYSTREVAHPLIYTPGLDTPEERERKFEQGFYVMNSAAVADIASFITGLHSKVANATPESMRNELLSKGWTNFLVLAADPQGQVILNDLEVDDHMLRGILYSGANDQIYIMNAAIARGLLVRNFIDENDAHRRG